MRIGYSDTGEYDEDRNFTYSAKGTYGTSGWMSRKEMAGVLELVSDLHKYQGIVLGMLDRKAVCVPEKTRLNSNLAVYGASGSMKTRSFCMNRILQGVSRGESLVICDPKSELYEKELAQKEAAAEKMVGEGVGFERIRRITGYLVGTLDRFNNAKRAEEHDRVRHCCN